MSDRLPLTFACWDYDRVLPLQDGRVQPHDIDLRFLNIAPPESFFRMLHFAEFGASEMSLSWYTRTVFRDPRPFQAIPAFPSRMFRHSSIYVNADSGIREPADLAGRRIGCPEYQMTLAVWVKGIMADVYGVPVESVTYCTGGLNEPGRREVAMDLPDNITVEPIGDHRTLSEMIETGEIDALYGPEPSTFRTSDRVQRLFPDYRAHEREYFQETGIFPIMHTAVVRQDILEAHPWAATSLLKALERSKEIAQAALFEIGAVKTMLPWLVDHAEDTQRDLGVDDWWPYGVEANRKVLATFLRYSHEQGLSPRLLEVDELFFPPTTRRSKT
jgi:4,5-dihydroxyphthalate decarboxylase